MPRITAAAASVWSRTLHLACAIPNASYFELLHEPPGMTTEDFQFYLQEPLSVDAEGNIVAPTPAPAWERNPIMDKLAAYRVD